MKINELIKTKEYNKLINLYNELKTKFIVENNALYDYRNNISINYYFTYDVYLDDIGGKNK